MKLASLLSVGAQICRPGSDCFSNATSRFVAGWAAPKFDMAVEVATQEDVQNTIRYANEQGKPFLAVSGRHGFTKSLGEMKNGVGIYMRQMNDVTISEDGKSATVGGGITSKELIDHLWARGKQSTTGACECTGIVSPMLGGGHGFLKGRYGLMTDNLISTDVVLADGSAVTVSESQHPDLFWAMRGAGQNFGIVTSFEYRIHDRTPKNELWSYDVMAFSTDKLEAVYEEAERQRQKAPVELGHWGFIIPVPEIDPSVHTLLFTVFYQGSKLPSKYTDPFHALGPIMSTPNVTEFPGFSKVLGMDLSSPVCQPGGPSYADYPVNLSSYNTTALREAVDILQSTPPDLHFSSMLIEGYSGAAVRAVPEASTAYPDRKRGILIGNLMNWPRARTDLAEEARRYGMRIQEALVRGSEDGKLHSYVNYAAGNEAREALYGYEPWRLEKLRGLKRRYDPYGRFNFYLPVEGEVMVEGVDGGKSEL
ncbi:hypothetical protein M409DRAFT_62748 [Zasmidium cellare ATCC 36951]|uniref:FAD-binding PCMH-type domain-containing protein n=1 Tax=Zasmidium cellare ATCC 36951 TaxID=1080233 RepID=A0A6A6D661_ZASCE|nr:uncharacterized protein M409DRAFT_62748 [Zasmidium cellare ATCC 36951]KAF2173156.1 hypothetical protein M409DRAFT_62748 [Zasmidium cellare ATCC 36951]